MQTPAQFVAEQRANVRTQKVFEALVGCAPNGTRLPHLRRVLPNMNDEHILAALDTLVSIGRVPVQHAPNQFLPGRTITSYALVDRERYPIRETITIGGVEFPRSMHGDLVGAEDLNALAEAIAAYDAKVEGRITALASAMTRRYWGNVATLLALFVAVFALILRASDPIVVEPTADVWRIVTIHAARLMPLAAILLAFVIATWLVVRKI